MKTSRQRTLAGLVCLLLVAALAWAAVIRPAAQPQRPQTPVAPLPYGVQEVAFSNASARLAGTLTLPATPGPHPGIVLIPGSGEVDRDGSLFGHQFYLVLADHLTRRGFAVLRSDKRGLGKSGGDFAHATSLDFAADIRTGVAFLRSRPEIDAGRIGLVGHSEGGLIGSLVAASDPGIAFLVLMAGNGIPAREMLLSRTRRQTAPDRVDKELALQQAVLSAVMVPGAEAAVRDLYLAAQREQGRAFSQEEAALYLSPWMRTLLALDPQAPLRRLHCPVLALVGGKDQVITAHENIPALRAALAANPRAQVRRLPGLNHFFQNAQTGDLSEVAAIEETMSPQALALISAWAARQAEK